MSECPHCDQERELKTPFSKMGERMYGRGVDEEVCMNPRCPHFGKWYLKEVKSNSIYGNSKT